MSLPSISKPRKVIDTKYGGVILEKLAINGGYPIRGGKLYYGRQWIGEDDVQAVADVLRSDYIT